LETDHITGPKHDLVAAPELDEEEVDGLHFFRTPIKNRWLYKIPLLNQWEVLRSLEKRLKYAVEKTAPDVLHAHSPALNGLAAINVARKYKIPLVYEIRAFWEDAAVDHGTSKEWGIRYRLTRALETRVVKGADAVTTICEGLREDIINRGIPKQKITVIPNAVDLERFQYVNHPNLKLQKQYNLEESVVVGFIGSFYAYEGLDLLLRAIPLVLKRFQNIKVLLVGGGPQENALKTLAKDLNISERVIFTGRVSHDQVQEYYSLIELFIYPRISIRLTELVTPLKPLEAMARGRIVLASDIGGHRELIEENRTGMLFKADSSEALSQAIIDLLENRNRWMEIRKAAREFIETKRNWEVSVLPYKNIYEKLVAKNK
jgi:PEP-CTERM/exosortase A-associated glycosyltransferase